jgi:hypothetical protein
MSSGLLLSHAQILDSCQPSPESMAAVNLRGWGRREDGRTHSTDKPQLFALRSEGLFTITGLGAR